MCERCEAKANDPRARALQDITVLEWIPRVDPGNHTVYVHQTYADDGRLLRWKALNMKGDDKIAAVRTIEIEVCAN
jgi:hypothetical protein